MHRRPRWPTMRVMVDRHVHLEIDVTIDASSISGHLTSGEPSGRDFSGRLGLITAIDEALAVDTDTDIDTDTGIEGRSS